MADKKEITNSFDFIRKFIDLVNSIDKYISEELDERLINPKIINRLLSKNNGVIPFESIIERSDYAHFLFEHQTKLPPQIINYLGHHPQKDGSINKDESLIKLELVLIMRDFLNTIAAINGMIEDYKIRKTLGTALKTNKADFSLKELLEKESPKEIGVGHALYYLNQQYRYFINKMVDLRYFDVTLSPNFELNFSNIQLIDGFRGVDTNRIRLCHNCHRLFFAKRVDAWTCSQSCRNTAKQRRWRRKINKERKVNGGV